MYALVDCNTFYASCERVFRPDLVGKPVIVLSNNDGCVIAQSSESKALGVKMGIPFFQVEPLVRQHNIAVFSSNYTLYGDISARVMNIMEEFMPKVEIYSIDEAFIDLRGMKIEQLDTLMREIRAKILQWTKIPVSIGVATSKTLAKCANKLAKRYPDKTGGVFVIDTEEKRIKTLKLTKVEDVWGIGYRGSSKIIAHGMRNAYEYSLCDIKWVRKTFTVVGERTCHELRGIPCIDMKNFKDKQGICTSRSFGKILVQKELLGEAIANFADKCALKLRRQNSVCSLVTVGIETNAFKLGSPQYFASRTLKLPVATADPAKIIHQAKVGLEMIFRPGYEYKRASVVVTAIVPALEVQFSVFDEPDSEKIKRLINVRDALNENYGQNTVRLAAMGVGKRNEWKMRNEFMSQRYTTRWKDICVVK